jgi:hypothetical protein
MIDPRVESLCKEFSIEIIGRHRYPEAGQTRAPTTIARIIDKRGEAHTRIVLSTLAETSNNKVCLDEVGLWATSDLVLACGHLVESETDKWLRVWDLCPVNELQYIARDLSGYVKQRAALAGMIYERIVRAFGPLSKQPDLFDDRRRQA